MKIGERIGDYEVIGVLGNGGMGEVYKVKNVLSERVEAMKVLLPNLAEDPELAERFLREIKLQASLDHPHIAKLHTAFRDSNRLLMVMEFVEGVSVESLLVHGALLAHDAVNYAGQALEALAYAHARGVVHRDIKPANLMLTSSGEIKLLDFGIAHMKADHKLTQTGTTLGSLYYIAPELINGGEPDARCDLYSLGVVLYEMVTGRKPFQGDTQYSILAAHMQSTPLAPAELAPWVTGPLNNVILQAMAKDPAERFQSAESFKSAMENASGPADHVAIRVMPPARTQALPNLPSSKPAQAGLAAAVSGPQPASAAAPRTIQRGLYVALGCILTLAVLAVAAIEAPKFLKTHADQPATLHRAAAQPVQAAAGQDQAGNSAAGSASPANTDSASPSENKPAAANFPSSESAPGARFVSAHPASEHQEKGQTAAQKQSVASAEALESYQSQMRELRQEAERLNVRAHTATTSLTSLKTQMASQGLGLRSDVVEAETRMNHHLEKAQHEIAGGDAISAEQDLRTAGYAIEFIEKFLGR